MMKSWKDYLDDELADMAQNGVQGQWAIVESLRRHRLVVVKLERTATVLSGVMVVVTIVGILAEIGMF